jgi:hypothetical protein
MTDDFGLDPNILPSAERRKSDKKRALADRRAKIAAITPSIAPPRGPFKALRTIAAIYKYGAWFTVVCEFLIGCAAFSNHNDAAFTYWLSMPVTLISMYAISEAILVFLSIEENIRKMREHAEHDRGEEG